MGLRFASGLAVLLFLAAGCSSTPSHSLAGGSGPLHIVSAVATAVDVPCPVSLDDQPTCHTVVVVMRNDSPSTPLDLANNGILWKAATTAGADLGYAQVHGPESLAAGGQATFRMSFGAPVGTRISTISYNAFAPFSSVSATIPTYTVMPWDPQFSLKLVGASESGSDCIDYQQDKHCHTLRITATNRNTTASRSLSQFYFKAEDAAGGLFSPYTSDGADEVAPGGTASIDLKFELAPGEKVVRVHYQQYEFPRTVDLAVPAY